MRGFINLNDFFYDVFLDLKRQEVRETTINNYISTINNLRKLRYKNLLLINEKDIIEELNCYNENYKFSVLKILSVVFDVAVNKNYRLKNPCQNVKVKRFRKKQINIFSKEQIKEILKEVKEQDKNLYLSILLGVYGGLRRGEIAGLKLSDIDFNNCTISINRQIVQAKGKSAHVSELKTQNSNRTIKINKFVLEEIKKYSKNNGFVISGRKYDYVSPNNITNRFHKLLKSLKIYNLRFHDLRVTHATFLIMNGIDVKTVSKRLGHANTNVTLDIYTAYVQSNDTKCVETLKNLVL